MAGALRSLQPSSFWDSVVSCGSHQERFPSLHTQHGHADFGTLQFNQHGEFQHYRLAELSLHLFSRLGLIHTESLLFFLPVPINEEGMTVAGKAETSHQLTL